jgi:hypothetical protein
MLSAIMPSVILSSVAEPLRAEEYCFAEYHYADFLCCPWEMKHIIGLVSLCLMAFCPVSWYPLELKNITLLTFVLSLEYEADHMLSVIMSNGILSNVMVPFGTEEYYSAHFCVVLGI